MSKSASVRVFSVRLPEAQRRQVKSLAASLGLSLQEVVHRALEAWVSQHDPQMSRRRNPQPAALGGAEQTSAAGRRRDHENTPEGGCPASRWGRKRSSARSRSRRLGMAQGCSAAGLVTMSGGRNRIYKNRPSCGFSRNSHSSPGGLSRFHGRSFHGENPCPL